MHFTANHVRWGEFAMKGFRKGAQRLAGVTAAGLLALGMTASAAAVTYEVTFSDDFHESDYIFEWEATASDHEAPVFRISHEDGKKFDWTAGSFVSDPLFPVGLSDTESGWEYRSPFGYSHTALEMNDLINTIGLDEDFVGFTFRNLDYIEFAWVGPTFDTIFLPVPSGPDEPHNIYYGGKVGITGIAFAVDGKPIISGAPEPATWLMLITGFGLAGMSARRRRSLQGI